MPRVCAMWGGETDLNTQHLLEHKSCIELDLMPFHRRTYMMYLLGCIPQLHKMMYK